MGGHCHEGSCSSSLSIRDKGSSDRTTPGGIFSRQILWSKYCERNARAHTEWVHVVISIVFILDAAPGLPTLTPPAVGIPPGVLALGGGGAGAGGGGTEDTELFRARVIGGGGGAF